MAAASLLNIIMAQNHNNAADDVKPTILHDFLGRGCAPPPKSDAAAAAGSSPSASVSGGGGGRAGGPVSTTSDLASERQTGTLFEGVPFYGPRTDFAGGKIRYSGVKRSNSDSGLLPPQLRPDFPETSHLMKMMRNVGAERPRWPHEDEPYMNMHQMRPTSSHMVQPMNAARWERAVPVNVGPVLQQYPPRAGQVVPYGYQPVSNRFKDSNAGAPLMSQSAADEGSRTGMKGSGVLSLVNVSGTGADQPSSSKLKSLVSDTEPGSSTRIPHQGSTSVSRQMTIFYGGQAHVFDDVHPNKADVIMTLAGSNGGSWSTSFLPNSSLKPSGGEAGLLSGGKGNILMKDARVAGGAEEKSEDKQ